MALFMVLFLSNFDFTAVNRVTYIGSEISMSMAM